MHEDDRHGIDAVGPGLLDGRANGGDVEQPFHAAVGAHALVYLDDALVELFGKNDLLGEDVGPRLIGDPQRIAKSPGDEQQHTVALTLQKRVGGNRGAHLDVADQAGWYRSAGS